MSTPAIVNAIIDVLEQDKCKQWNQETLAKHVLDTKKPGVTATPHIEYAIRSMVASGRINGVFDGTSRTDRIKWKPAQDQVTAAAIRMANKQITDLRSEVEQLKAAKPEDVNELIEKLRVKDEAVESAAATTRAVAAARDAALADLEQLKTAYEQSKDQVFEVRTRDAQGEQRSTTGLFHDAFKRVLKLAAARKNVFIYGPTGCGKTHICSQVAEALNLPFYFVSCSSGMSEGQVTGRLLPIGSDGKFEFIVSEFLRAYETGGVFLLDEMDAADANVLLVVNSALANGRMAVPNRPEAPYATRHPDFVCIAAANTVGTGASRTYSGRNKLDMATLDRFAIGKVYMDYDPRVEEALCPDETLRKRLLKWREAINEHALERAMSTRFMQDAYSMRHDQPDGMCFDDKDIEDAFFQGWREDERSKVLSY